MSRSIALYPLPPQDDVLIPSDALPAYVGLSAKTLARWRCQGSGPPFVKVGRKVLYRTRNVRQWLAQGLRASTSERPAAIRNEFMAA